MKRHNLEVKYDLTLKYREEFVSELKKLDIGEVFSGKINCVLLHLSQSINSMNSINSINSINSMKSANDILVK